MNLEQTIMAAVITLLGALVAHLLTKDKMNEKFSAEIQRLRAEVVLQTACNTCQANQKERREALESWLKTIEAKLDRVIESR